MEQSSSNILKKTAYAVVSAVIVNLVFIFIVKLFVHPPSTFSPFFYNLIALYTALGVTGAGIVYAIIKKFTPRYNKVFTWISIITLVLSLIPDIGIYTSPGPDDIGATIPIVIILMLTHVFAAYIAVRKLTK
jgi:hypothetical protein